MAKLISGGVNFVLDAKAPDRKDLFLKEAMLLKQSHSLCSSMTTERERHEAAYMEAVRSTVIKITYVGLISYVKYNPVITLTQEGANTLNMDKNLNKFLDRMSMSEYDVPEYLFSLKESLLRGKAIDESYLIPSLYLKSIFSTSF